MIYGGLQYLWMTLKPLGLIATSTVPPGPVCPPPDEGTIVFSVLGVFNVTCSVCQFGFADALLLYLECYESNFGGQWVNTFCYDTAYCNIWSVLIFMGTINVLNFAAQLFW